MLTLMISSIIHLHTLYYHKIIYLTAATEAKRGKANPFVGYRAGGLRALVCGEEAATGTYPILRSYTSLLAAAIKVKRYFFFLCYLRTGREHKKNNIKKKLI